MKTQLAKQNSQITSFSKIINRLHFHTDEWILVSAKFIFDLLARCSNTAILE